MILEILLLLLCILALILSVKEQKVVRNINRQVQFCLSFAYTSDVMTLSFGMDEEEDQRDAETDNWPGLIGLPSLIDFKKKKKTSSLSLD